MNKQFRLGRNGSGKTLLRQFVSRANAARDEGRRSDAATLFGEAIKLAPHRADLYVQRAHMLKECGDYPAAEALYDEAYRLTPQDADLCLQRGHFFKTVGRLQDALTAYSQALEIKPRWLEPRRWLDELHNIGLRDSEGSQGAEAAAEQEILNAAGTSSADLSAGQITRLVRHLTPQPKHIYFHHHQEAIEVRRLGRLEPSFWGNLKTLRGVEAIRGYCISEVPIIETTILLNGFAVYKSPMSQGHPLAREIGPSKLRKYVFNLWYDFSYLAIGRHKIEIRCIDAEGRPFSYGDEVQIAPPLNENDYPDSDALVNTSQTDPSKLESEIRQKPSMIRPARRSVLPERPKKILVMRTDQLGDMISSIAAIRRLSEIFHDADLVGLVTASNEGIASTLGLFSDIIVIDFPDDELERRRVMPLPEQERLRQRLASYQFDMAIDLSQSGVSRELLLLSGAPFLYGTGNGDEWPWLTAEFGVVSRDTINRLDFIPHSTKTLALVESLGAITSHSFKTMRRSDLRRTDLAKFGIDPDESYVVLHMGARIKFSRWPHFLELAQKIIGKFNCKVVAITDDRSTRATLPEDLRNCPQFILIDERPTFDEFDTMISYCTTLVGNDSGPKHLAALRGVPVVTIFTARINWNQWGQEEIGTIISRRVPCAGCDLFHDSEECGKDFACIRDITADEVMSAMRIA